MNIFIKREKLMEKMEVPNGKWTRHSKIPACNYKVAHKQKKHTGKIFCSHRPGIQDGSSLPGPLVSLLWMEVRRSIFL